MKITIIPADNHHLPDRPHRLFLEAENLVDSSILERLAEEYHCTNTSRDPETGRVWGAAVELDPKEAR